MAQVFRDAEVHGFAEKSLLFSRLRCQSQRCSRPAGQPADGSGQVPSVPLGHSARPVA